MNIQKYSAFSMFKNVIFAFFMRELKTRFGKNKMGYVWMVIEPLSHIIILSTIFSLVGRTVSPDIPFAMILLLGLLPYFLFKDIVSKTTEAISSNIGLMMYAPVKMIDPMISRLMIELMVFFLTFFSTAFVFFILEIFILPDNFLVFLGLLLELVLFAFALGMIFAVIKEYYQDFGKIIKMIFAPLYFLSGIFYTAEIIPVQYREYILWNPIFNWIEAFRGAYFYSLDDRHVSYTYIHTLTLLTLFIGFIVYEKNKEIFKVVK